MTYRTNVQTWDGAKWRRVTFHTDTAGHGLTLARQHATRVLGAGKRDTWRCDDVAREVRYFARKR